MTARGRIVRAKWPWLLPGILLGGLGGCGSGDVDSADELGLEQETEAERYELVIVQGDPSEGAEAALSDTAAGLNTPVVYDPEGDFTVQIGVYRDAKLARHMVRQLTDDGYPAYAVPRPDTKGVRVRIGYFSTRADAQRFGQLIKKDRDLDFWVDRRANERL